jgi:transposase
VAIGRKNYLFMGSDNRGKAAAILYCMMASAKANQVEPFA